MRSVLCLKAEGTEQLRGGKQSRTVAVGLLGGGGGGWLCGRLDRFGSVSHFFRDRLHFLRHLGDFLGHLGDDLGRLGHDLGHLGHDLCRLGDDFSDLLGRGRLLSSDLGLFAGLLGGRFLLGCRFLLLLSSWNTRSRRGALAGAPV
ncbi:hypothetical protein EYF80_038746 [Liparis tanakae]|uniref:Uncharacterized protein n=1 Tax=Liparis tanakae TaxID=230148 RepID=A0A4Z2GD56_9TELE|nr:hypothetical protein EYF80_038746 [Liparis tanakae]